MKALHLIALLLAAGVAAHAQGTTNEAAAVANALQIEAARGTNADGFCFLSLQHPEWPPMPTSPDPKLEVVRVGVGTYLVDDANWVYPKPPAVATNAAALRANESGLAINTNYIATHLGQVDFIKRHGVLADFPTNTASRVTNALNARRARLACEVIDAIVAAARKEAK